MTGAVYRCIRAAGTPAMTCDAFELPKLVLQLLNLLVLFAKIASWKKASKNIGGSMPAAQYQTYGTLSEPNGSGFSFAQHRRPPFSSLHRASSA
jgi:hypothetical protein